MGTASRWRSIATITFSRRVDDDELTWKRMRSVMLRIKINCAPTSLFARPRPDGGWDLRCIDPVVGEFRIYSGDVLHMWSDETEEWLPASEGDLAERAVREAEQKGG